MQLSTSNCPDRKTLRHSQVMTCTTFVTSSGTENRRRMIGQAFWRQIQIRDVVKGSRIFVDWDKEKKIKHEHKVKTKMIQNKGRNQYHF